MSRENCDSKLFGHRLLKARKKLGLTQEDFAKPVQIGKSAISQVENGLNAMSDPTLTLLCSVHGLNKDWLLTGSGEMFAPTPSESPSVPIPNALVGDLDELLRDAREVLSSGNAMAAEALAKNIKYFAHAVQQERRLAKVEAGQAATDAKMAALMEEFTRLKEHYGIACDLNPGAPHTAPAAKSPTDKAI